VTLVSEWELDEWDRIARSVGADAIERLKLPARWD
jgi:hypothetical protein